MTHGAAAWISNEEIAWIHVTDELPKYGQKVEVRFFEKGGNIVVADAVFLEDSWAVDFGEHGDRFAVAYWRPIKDKEEDDGDSS